MTDANTLHTLRTTSPLVHCITNYVAMQFSANTLLAAGASPAMVHATEEAAEFTPICGALSINIGTLSTPWLDAMRASARAANAQDLPWVLDPVAHFISAYRRDACAELVALKPAIIKGNASEIMALNGTQSAGRGVDSGDSVKDAKHAARMLANQTGAIVMVTGEVDHVTDGTQCADISGGSHWMPRVTAMGCSLGSLTAAYAAITTPFDAAVSAAAHFAAAGDWAQSRAAGPGSFHAAFLDGLALIGDDQLAPWVTRG
ncbi:hydroxyethylthiazole kinase [Litorivicinus lipolyticus]|uniref:Hydroxyethylthiazole kinase n=1 Tax=Litorivicinus lipolyticus TaxID=418701 RepID=A0A5Q2QCP5_9GAMM|nr:hydroxyethylthiazole kinase [Litorivicinus lipolyticus]QGG81073.1 hydroxyethylthiazole kinase [Litorivicinus lipolyticus]